MCNCFDFTITALFFPFYLQMHHKSDRMESIRFDQSPLAGTDLITADTNNNNQKNEIYSLRQRKQRRTKGKVAPPVEGFESEYVKPPRRGEPKEKPKPKAAPLSKYRRKTANARERTRMREINCAFEHLRQCVPVSITGVETPSNNEKLTKITTLRLAMKYIRILSEILTKSSSSEANNGAEPAFNYQDIYNDILNDTLFKPTVTKPTGGRKELKKQNAPPAPPKVKKPTNRARRKYNTKQNGVSSGGVSSKMAAKMVVVDPTASCGPMDGGHKMDIGLTLESDGESLQFSEPCLSPLEHEIKFTSPHDHHSLELGLLLESDGESLELSEPCLSPLSHLDSLNPFSDLLHTGFNEQSIDMFLS